MHRLNKLRIGVLIFAAALWFLSTLVGGVSLLVPLAISAVVFVLPSLRRKQGREMQILKDASNLTIEKTDKGWRVETGWQDGVILAMLIVVGYAISRGTDPIALLQVLTKAGSSS